jgi:hypothetical protein
VISLGAAVRQLSADLAAVVTAFERQLGALEREQGDFAEMRREEAVEFGLRAAAVLHYVAQSFPSIPLPPSVHFPEISRAEGLPTEVQAYLFRSAVTPSQMNEVLTLTLDGYSRERVERLPHEARQLAQFFDEWDGRPALEGWSSGSQR